MLTKRGNEEERNQLCGCGSGLKYKKCHGDPGKLRIAQHVATEAMDIMIAQTRNERGDIDGTAYSEVVMNPELVLRRFFAQFGLMVCPDCGVELKVKCEKCEKVG